MALRAILPLYAKSHVIRYAEDILWQNINAQSCFEMYFYRRKIVSDEDVSAEKRNFEAASKMSFTQRSFTYCSKGKDPSLYEMYVLLSK